MSQGIHFNRENVYKNMWDFLKDLKWDYKHILESTDLHFGVEVGIMYPMIWSICKQHATTEQKQILEKAILTWFKYITKHKNK